MREEIFKNHIQFFHPSSSELLIEWIRQEEQFTNNKERIQSSNNFEIHDSNHQQYLTDTASSYIRHIIFNHGIHPTRFPSLLSAFTVLLLGRPPNESELR